MYSYLTYLKPALILLFASSVLLCSTGFADERSGNTPHEDAQNNTGSGEKPHDGETLESILQNYQKAVGGKSAWKKMNTLKITGNMHSMGTVFMTTVVYKRPDMCRMDFSTNNMTFIESYDGTTPWQIGMVGRVRAPVQLEGKRALELKQTCDFDGPLVGHETKGYDLEYEGKEEVNGRIGYKINVTYENDTVDTYYLDEKTYLPFMVKGTTSVHDKTIRSTTHIDDFIQTGDIKIPYYYEFELEGVPGSEVLRIYTVEMNPEIKKGFFSMPRNLKDSY